MKPIREYATGKSRKMRNVTVLLTLEQYDKLKETVDKEERSIAWFLRKLILNALDNEETSA